MKFLCPSDTLAPNSSRGFDIDGHKLLAVRRDGIAYFYRNRCPHRGVPLEWQRSIDTSVRTSGAHISRSDTVQRIAIPAGLLADTRQILFAVLIDQDHEIQT